VCDHDVLHAQDVINATSQVALRAARGCIPTVVTQHVGFVSQRNGVLDALQSTVIRLVRSSAARADRVV
jgi:hypothetical protein